MIVPTPWAQLIGFALLGLAIIVAILAWRTYRGSIPPEVLVLLERIRSDREVVHSAPDDPRARVLTVVPVPSPKVTPQQLAAYREIERQLRVYNWNVRGWPIPPAAREANNQ